jgi:hypothetical protein
VWSTSMNEGDALVIISGSFRSYNPQPATRVRRRLGKIAIPLTKVHHW